MIKPHLPWADHFWFEPQHIHHFQPIWRFCHHTDIDKYSYFPLSSSFSFSLQAGKRTDHCSLWKSRQNKISRRIYNMDSCLWPRRWRSASGSDRINFYWIKGRATDWEETRAIVEQGIFDSGNTQVRTPLRVVGLGPGGYRGSIEPYAKPDANSWCTKCQTPTAPAKKL